MPPAIPALIGAAAAAGLGSALAGTALGLAIGGLGVSLVSGLGGAAASYLVSGLIGRNDGSLSPTVASQGGRTETIRAATTPQRVVYGRARLGGVRTFAHSKESTAGLSTRPNGLFYVLDTFTGHEIDGFEEIWLGDTRSTDPQWTGKLRLSLQRGARGQVAHKLLVDETEGKWTAAHRQRGWSSIAAEFTYDESLYPSGIPSILPVIRGRRVWDPRTGAVAWSQNSALIVADYLMADFGLRETEANIDIPALIEAANVCDERVATLSGTAERRYQTNGVLSLDAAPRQILEALLAPMAGEAIWTGGTWRIQAGAYRPPLYGFTASHLRGDISVRWRRPARDRTNVVRAVFVRPDADWQEFDAPELRDAAAIAEDSGVESVLDLDLTLCTSGSQVQRVMAIAHRRNRLQREVEVPLNLAGITAQAGDTITFAAGRLPSGTYRCARWLLNEDGSVDLSLRQEAASVYAWSTADETPLQPPGVISTSTDAYAVPQPTIVAPITAEFTSLQVSWPASPNAQAYDIEARAATQTAWTNASTASLSIVRTVTGPSEIRVRATGPAGVSRWGSAPLPAMPELLVVRNTASGLDVDVPGLPPGGDRFQIFHAANAGAIGSATKLASEPSSGTASIALANGTAQRVWIRTVGTTGNVSSLLGVDVIAGTSGQGGSASSSGGSNSGGSGTDGGEGGGGADPIGGGGAAGGGAEG